ncbi:MAG: DUF3341 domain-containing protein [Leptospiraceae bacterium]|nr:DUF3341 domain-containing protein [Leptospiraceae bacterium]
MPIPKILPEQFHTYKEAEKGVFGLFDGPDEILEAAEKTKEKGYRGFECYTPYPVHGLDDATGIARSGIPWITFFMGIFGCFMGYLFPYLVHSVDWPINFSGKDLNAWPAYVPVIFEVTVFFAAISSGVAFLYLSGCFSNPLRKPLHKDITSHKFALWIPADATGYKEEEVKTFITGLGAKEVTVVK